MATKKKYTLSDDAISNLVKLLQLGLLTGTDIADNFRLLELVADGDKLVPSSEYLGTLETNLQKMQEQADSLANKQVTGFKGFN